MPNHPDHAVLLEAAQRELAELRLAGLRDPTSWLSTSSTPARDRLLSPEGEERLEGAVREHRYSHEELRFVPRQLAELARAAVMSEGQRWLAGWLTSRIGIGSEARSPGRLLSWLASPMPAGYSPAQILAAYDGGLVDHASFLVELVERADHAHTTQLMAAEKICQPASQPDESVAAPLLIGRGARPQPPVVPRAGQVAPPPTQDPGSQLVLAEGAEIAALLGSETPAKPTRFERAQTWLEQTDDAARELFGWLVKRVAGHPRGTLGDLVTAIRAESLDGLAPPSRRFLRLAAGARRLGFERDMTARMHGETGHVALLPFSSCVAVAVPDNVHVVQSERDMGLLSDLAVAQGLGEALGLALTSPALGSPLRRPLGESVSSAFGGLFLQLRADAGYLRAVDGFERDTAAPAARHAAFWLLLRSRLSAALLCAAERPARSTQAQVTQLMAAAERALGWELPRGLAALTLLSQLAQPFEAITRGCELHAALRERYDVDYYMNPRVEEVLRGAAVRGNSLTAEGFASELGSDPARALPRLIELLG
ncbi:MAG: hypothetical protein ABW321_08475 [Polyangiales bacterium]